MPSSPEKPRGHQAKDRRKAMRPSMLISFLSDLAPHHHERPAPDGRGVAQEALGDETEDGWKTS